jgi:two-component system, NtrC family, sensor kinase
MRLSIYARIFAGILVVLIAFGGVMGYTFLRMHRLRQDLQLINRGYLRLALILAELHTHQGNLLYAIAEATGGHGTSSSLRNQVRAARLFRERQVAAALRVVRESRESAQTPRDRRYLDHVETRLDALRGAFGANDPLFEELFPSAEPVPRAAPESAGKNLLRLEGKLVDQIRRLFEELRGQVQAAALQVEEDETHGIWASLGLAILAVLVSLVVVFGTQRTLRPLRWLVAGTKRIGTGDYAHRVEVTSGDELGLLAREFNSMAAAIEEREHLLIRSERMAAAGRIASHITHEIRNPLSSISLNTELLEEELGALDPAATGGGDGGGAESAQRPSDEAKGLLRAIRKEVDRLTEITEEYLRFARLPRPRLEPESINEIFLDLLSFMRGELEARGITVERSLDPDLPTVEADENQLRQAFLNLLRNAGEAMSAGATLTVSTRATEGRVAIRITDTGSGIDPEDLPRVFEPFFSTKEGGTGLGLALTQQIVQEHGGTIEVESVAGRGTTFTIELPAQRPPSGTQARDPAAGGTG